MLIEFQGRQHYEPVDFFNKSNDLNRALKFEKNKRHDEIKREYCNKNNIDLLEIPYWNIKNIEEILKKYFLKEVA